ncbi:hypothetical protein SO802_010762 [Lithocarpus litseifolius]|uniref:Reverse transcriptase domain-containing protein n=1 Tax=Lithocarpus litseifolius TaxID=425828 RepID=A0AAW2DIX2_9ROSI
MNASLTKEFHPDEVWTALQQMHPLKSPGPDGMPPIFYQKFWNIVGPNVIECVLNILNSGSMPPDFNATHICLIPKRNNPQKVTDYRPISLTNVLSRIVSKVLANRLKKILPHIISMSQSAFLPDSAGRETLIKAVAQATPTYSMSCFKLPDSLCKELGAMICRFWWGQKKEERKIPWIAWDKLCKPKADGGMGFKDLKSFNLALLAKQGWRLLHNQNTLFHQVFKAKYFENSTFLEAELGKHPSFAWRSIMAAKNVVAEGTRWSVGKGNKIRLWEDKWLPTLTHFKPVSPRKNLQEGNQVSSLIDQTLRAWREDVVRNTFLPHEAEIILGIPLSSFPTEDRRVWSATANGVFSVRNAYRVAQ